MKTIYTDGSAVVLDKKYGSYAAVVLGDDGECVGEMQAFMEGGTVGLMELSALQWALFYAMEKDVHVLVRSDSEYVVRGYNDWLEGWEGRNFSGIKFREIWLNILKVKKKMDAFGRRPVVEWVKGHNGDKWNEQADALAGEALKMGIMGERKFFLNVRHFVKEDVKFVGMPRVGLKKYKQLKIGE